MHLGVSSNDHSELWLSADDDPVNKVRIGFVNGHTNVRQWDKYVGQCSGIKAVGTRRDGNGFDGRIEIQRVTGEMVYSEDVHCAVHCMGYSISIAQQLTPGVYLVM